MNAASGARWDTALAWAPIGMSTVAMKGIKRPEFYPPALRTRLYRGPDHAVLLLIFFLDVRATLPILAGFSASIVPPLPSSSQAVRCFVAGRGGARMSHGGR